MLPHNAHETGTLLYALLSITSIALLFVLAWRTISELLFEWAKKHYIQESLLMQQLQSSQVTEAVTSKVWRRRLMYALVCAITDPNEYQTLVKETPV
jgi:hypothetical protein